MYVRYDISVAVGSFCLFTSRLEQENKMKKTQRAVLQHDLFSHFDVSSVTVPETSAQQQAAPPRLLLVLLQ